MKVENQHSNRIGFMVRAPQKDGQEDDFLHTFSTLSRSVSSQDTNDDEVGDANSCNSTSSYVVIDPINISRILGNLAEMGYTLASDKFSRKFVPTKDTKKLLATKERSLNFPKKKNKWQRVHGKNILTWICDPDEAGAFKSSPTQAVKRASTVSAADRSSSNSLLSLEQSPMIHKARGNVATSPFELAEYLMDSSKVQEYNLNSLGRTDVNVFQSGITTAAAESAFGFSGECKIVDSKNRLPLFNKIIEMRTLLHAQPLREFLSASKRSGFFMDKSSGGEEDEEQDESSYLIVSRSVFSGDDEKSLSERRIELILSVILIRPACGAACPSNSEITFITHMQTRGMPKWLVNKITTAKSLERIRALQDVFQKKNQRKLDESESTADNSF